MWRVLLERLLWGLDGLVGGWVLLVFPPNKYLWWCGACHFLHPDSCPEMITWSSSLHLFPLVIFKPPKLQTEDCCWCTHVFVCVCVCVCIHVSVCFVSVNNSSSSLCPAPLSSSWPERQVSVNPWQGREWLISHQTINTFPQSKNSLHCCVVWDDGPCRAHTRQ